MRHSMWIVLEQKRDLKQVPDFYGGRKVYRVAPAGPAENRHFWPSPTAERSVSAPPGRPDEELGAQPQRPRPRPFSSAGQQHDLDAIAMMLLRDSLVDLG